MMMKRIAFVALFAWLACQTPAVFAAPTDSIWELQAVDGNGVATDSRVGATEKVVIEGIVLNASEEYLDPNVQFQIFVQGEAPDAGGIAAWSGSFFQGGPGSAFWQTEYARLTTSGFQPGNRVRVTGFVAFHQGKTNINERHSASPDMDFDIELLEAGVGMPTPTVLPGVAASTLFDQTRATGGERYQGTWCRLENVWLDPMPDGWGADQTVYVTDDGVNTLAVKLSAMGDFNDYVAPTGLFSVTGIFNQEDATDPYTGDYQLWVKNFDDFETASDNVPVPEPSVLVLAVLGLGAGLARNRRRTM
jgi:hypothetical protein